MIDTKNYINSKEDESSSVNTYLKELISNIEPTQRQKERIKTRLDLIRNFLEKLGSVIRVDGLSQSIYIQGSWKRNTLIRKSNDSKWDVDMLVLMGSAVPGWSDRGNGPLIKPRSKIETLTYNLKKLYPNMEIHRDYPCTTLSYKEDNLDIELIPAYVFDTQMYYKSYDVWADKCSKIFTPKREYRIFGIPDPKNDDHWLYIRPFWFESELADCNIRIKGKLIPLIKILKHWNNLNGQLLKSYEIERFSD